MKYGLFAETVIEISTSNITFRYAIIFSAVSGPEKLANGQKNYNLNKKVNSMRWITHSKVT